MRGRGSWLVLCVVASAAAVNVAPVSAKLDTGEAPRSEQTAAFVLLERIEQARDETWQLERLMGEPLTAYGGSIRQIQSTQYEHWVLRLWTARAAAERRRANHPPRLRAWLCIHRYEGAWNDPGGPYYGGLQMDLEFQQTYGAHLLRTKGTADHWTPIEQIWVAERAYRSGRGFYPWPNTARWCGLI